MKRMKIICEILRMPEDEPGIRRLVHESSSALAKLQEVALPRTEGDHYGKAPAPSHAAPVAHAAGAGAAASSSLAVPPAGSPVKSPSPSAVSGSPSRSPSASPAPTLLDYQTASIPALALEMLRRKEGALEELDDRCLTSDNANDFMTVGGIEPLLIAMLSAYPGIKWRAAQALSTMVQNNPKAQKHAFEHRALEYLLPLLNPPGAAASASSAAAASSSAAAAPAALPLPPTAVDPSDDAWTVVVKALTALSALVRSDDLPVIRESFMSLGGFDRICILLFTPATPLRAQTKLFNFLKLLWSWFPAAKQRVLSEREKHILPILVAAVGQSEDISHREACLRALLEFAKATGTAKDQAAAKALREKHLGLDHKLHARARQLKAIKNQEDREQAQEELELTNALIKACKF